MESLAAIVLASASPRRKTLLEEAGVAFSVRPVEVPEPLEDFDRAESAAAELAERKAQACYAGLRGREHWVIGSDTVVAIVAEQRCHLLGKPADEEQAALMLGRLSGTRHAVVTGVCVLRCRDGWQFRATETTWVSMRAIELSERADYVASGEWRGKAGGYAIQETADRFVTALEGGGFDNVVGLPVRLTLDLLARAGAPGLPPSLPPGISGPRPPASS